MTYKVQPIDDLTTLDVSPLVSKSEEEGYRFLSRLVHDYEDGSNRFDKQGEALLGVWDDNGELVAIGGLNVNPYSAEAGQARLRRFYTLPQVRRKGVGSLLLKELVTRAKENFTEINLRTDSAKADAFYRANGFTETHDTPDVTHRLVL
ncbi:GNAT family N-acetyltransferase [Paenisporosarcina cavernae]|uniref:N-acetyltransferase n=1 Tax=Paenisporosarcina cavernae TaxID=2320858 RepID=A0A385YTS1_9BACL|nr:GNAT family N-acetyltransferase [Paenisporosarcina cavernae]AYC30275.1 N-acetyltransferase [Paenisporosarcina cavernae]